MKSVTQFFQEKFPAEEVAAHCDGPCGVYDPASARIAAEAVLSMTKKILALTPPEGKDDQAWMHKGRWARTDQIVKEQQEKVNRFYEYAVEQALKKWPKHWQTQSKKYKTWWLAWQALKPRLVTRLITFHNIRLPFVFQTAGQLAKKAPGQNAGCIKLRWRSITRAKA